MKYFKKDSAVYAFESDGSQDRFIPSGAVPMSALEVSEHVSPPKTTEQLREEWKTQRAAQVDAIKVTTAAGNTFDGDEVSQGRMARAVSSMEASDSVIWVLANNTVINATRAELKEALRLAGSAQAAIWIQ